MELFNFKDIQPFIEPANKFRRDGYYTNAAIDTIEYNRYWDEQERRCLNGYEYDGIRITGDHYFYLNFSRIDKHSGESGSKTTNKIEDFPDFWDGDYLYYHVLDIAKNGISPEEYNKLKLPVNIKESDRSGGKHLAILKTRRRGYSYKNASLAAKYYSLIRKSNTFVTAYQKELYSVILSMISLDLNFLNEHTGFGKTRDFIDKLTLDNFHVEASHERVVNDRKVKKGYLSQIKGITLKDNPHALRGKSANLILFEEAGSNPLLKDAWKVTMPSLEAGKYKTGTMIAFGCVCKGTKVWTGDGRQINIEHLKQEDGIIGYGGKGATIEPIIWMKPPAQKDCYRITTINGLSIECSDDHPLLSSKLNNITYKGKSKDRKIVTFKTPKELQVGDQLMSIRQIPIFGNQKIWNPRLIGLLIGDGYYGKGSTPELSIDSDEVYNWVKGNYSNVTLHKEFNTKSGYKYRSVTLPGTKYELEQIGLYGQTWENKHLPSNIYQCDLKSITELLGGYFDADGCVIHNKKKDTLRIVLTSKYKHLLEEVKLLLYKLNIGCSIIKEYRKGGFKSGDVHRLYISKIQDVEQFKKHIKFITKRKQDILDSFNPNNKKRQGVHDNCLFRINDNNGKGTYYLKDDNNRLNNLISHKIKSIEYIGKQDVYNLNAGMTHTYITNGFISGNTGGDLDGGMDFIEMFYNPEPYDLISLENMWDEGKENTFVSLFVPDYLNKEGFIDNNGNSDIVEAKIYEEERRDKIKRTASDSALLDKHVAEYPFTCAEAMLSSNINKFPVRELSSLLARLESNKKYFDAEFNGYFIINEANEVEFKSENKIPLRNFPIKKGDDIAGCVTIWEHPYLNDVEKVPYGMYVAGIDPVALQEAPTSNSVNAVFILNTITNRVVAEYVGRTNNSKDFYEQTRRLIKYYNSLLLYENMVTGIFDYFDYKNELYLLADPPSILANLIQDSKIKRKKGCHMTPAVKSHGIDLINNWLRDDDNQEGETNLYGLRSVGLIKELIHYNSEDNFDRVVALMMTLIQANEMRKKKDNIDATIILSNKDKSFFNKRIFTNKGSYRIPIQLSEKV